MKFYIADQAILPLRVVNLLGSEYRSAILPGASYIERRYREYAGGPIGIDVKHRLEFPCFDGTSLIDIRGYLGLYSSSVSRELRSRFMVRSGYYLEIYSPENSTTYQIRLTRDNTALATLESGTLPTNTWFARYFRFQANGTALKVKIWASGSEPSSWGAEVTDATYSSGNIGHEIWFDTYNDIAVYSRIGLYGIAIGELDPPASAYENALSGQVTLGGNPVSGAKILAMHQDTISSMMLLPQYQYAFGVSDQYGNYSLTVKSTGPWHVAARHEVGEQKYTAEGKPYIVLS